MPIVEVKKSVGIAKTKDYPQQVLKAGAKFDAKDRRVKNNPDHFRSVEDGPVADLVEAATAAPGEKREVKPRKYKPDTNAQNKKKAKASMVAAAKAAEEAAENAAFKAADDRRIKAEKAAAKK